MWEVLKDNPFIVGALSGSLAAYLLGLLVSYLRREKRWFGYSIESRSIVKAGDERVSMKFEGRDIRRLDSHTVLIRNTGNRAEPTARHLLEAPFALRARRPPRGRLLLLPRRKQHAATDPIDSEGGHSCSPCHPHVVPFRRLWELRLVASRPLIRASWVGRPAFVRGRDVLWARCRSRFAHSKSSRYSGLSGRSAQRAGPGCCTCLTGTDQAAV